MPIKTHAVVLLGPSAGGDPTFIGAKCRRVPTFYWGHVQERIHLLYTMSYESNRIVGVLSQMKYHNFIQSWTMKKRRQKQLGFYILS